MLAAVAGQVMTDTSSRRPPQVAQASTSMVKVRRIRSAQAQRPRAGGPLVAASSADLDGGDGWGFGSVSRP